ncbi:7883_t:CDS:2 [Paraglomus occultum]|uniref:7883_t:CDS:1 n=1 Tax=Paraglomus occultum TaxID=144539 RepID=A0A9N9AJP2_9GLOM|nr:7883_t:CDS:2 [Paraglomus occultum]
MFGDLFAARDVEVPKVGKDHTGSSVPEHGGAAVVVWLLFDSFLYSEGPSTFNEIVDNWTSSLRFIQDYRYTPSPIKEFVGELLEYDEKRSESERTPLTDLTNVGVVGPNSVIVTQPPSITDIRGWSTEQLIRHLQAKFFDDLDDEDLEILQKQKIKAVRS